jgi:hypothetical protein
MQWQLCEDEWVLGAACVQQIDVDVDADVAKVLP